MYIEKKDQKIIKNFEEKGFIIFKSEEKKLIDEIKDRFKIFLPKKISDKKIKNSNNFFNNTHKFVEFKKLNNFRLDIIKKINSSDDIKKKVYKISKKYLDILVGNELAIQKRINLSIQLPNDSSSLLPLHADTWSGVSPFETVIWLPLVDCYRTKTMYILPANKVKKYENKFLGKKIKSSQQIFNLIKKDLIWLKVNYGEVLVFDQSLPHGNIVNIEKETRWSMNIRFKGLFTPYGDKKLGEFFEPITLKPISKKGMNYKLPRQ
jgi:sporadic carbohydrate cluster 2OG-Fe(II) oxygenase